jgi:hypothetical protein
MFVRIVRKKILKEKCWGEKSLKKPKKLQQTCQPFVSSKANCPMRYVSDIKIIAFFLRPFSSI